MTRCAVVGHPVEHSLSPTIHRAAYRLLGLDDWEYGRHDVAPGGLEAFVASRDASWRGLSVTMPHKEDAARLGEPDGDVRLTGVANTLVWHSDGPRSAHNTDIEGFVAALAASRTPTVATVVGSGATARSAVVALVRLGATTIEVKARSRERAGQLAAWAARDVAPGGAFVVSDWGAPQDERSRLVVSTLPADAAAPLAPTLDLARLAAVFDVSYDPWPSALGAAALASGVEVLDGVDLLVHQAVAQVRLMTGRAVAAGPLLSAARAELERRAGA